MSYELGLIDEIQKVRARNNKCWMDIVRIAMKNAPQETKATLQEIQKNDLQISQLNGLLSNQDEAPLPTDDHHPGPQRE